MKKFLYRLLDLVGRLLSRSPAKDKKQDEKKDTQPPDTNYPLW